METPASELLRLGIAAAESKKATDVVALDLRELSSVTDTFVICSGSSDTNVRAIADAVEKRLKEEGVRPFGIEGYREGTWVLMDYIDFVFHIFHFEKRLVFALEDLWKDAPRLQTGTARKAAGEGP
jgi:ribosome-associated protein